MTDSNHQSTLSKQQIDAVVALYSNGQYQEAIDYAKNKLERFPENSILHNIAGACYVELGDQISAVKNYQKAILIQPDYAKAHYNLGALYHEMGKFDESIESYEKSLVIDPEYAEAHNNLANVLREFGFFDSAIIRYKEALKLEPELLEAHYGLGILYQELGKIDLMLEHLNKVIDIQPDNAEVHNRIGEGFEQLGQLKEAINSFNHAVFLNPKFSEAYYNLGNAFKEIGQFKDSIKALKIALNINPNYPAIYNNLGIAYKLNGHLNKAVKVYLKGLLINPDYINLLNNLGVAYTELGKIDDAIECLNKAISIKSDYADAYNNIGVAYNKSDQLEKASHSFEKAIRINPDFPDPYNNLTVVYRKKGLINELNNCFTKAIERMVKELSINPDNADMHNDLGIAYFEIERLEDAINSYKKALRINPKFADAHNNLGIALERLKRYEDSIKSFEKALNLKPDIDYILGNIVGSKMNSCNWDDLESLLGKIKNKIKNNKKIVDPFNLMAWVDDPELQRKASEIRVNSDYPQSDLLPAIGRYSKHPKIRIGYFSPDFREHPVGFLTAGLYEAHNRDWFEIHVFSFGIETKDKVNLRIKAGVDHYHEVDSMSHMEITSLARSLEIDIAVDLAGLTAESRTSLFAMSVAPIQLSYIGYLGTMGADYYDYLIADPIMIPKESQKHYVEKIAYLPNFQVNDSKDLPPELTMTRKELGLPETGFVFCCFNNTYKFTPKVFDSWAHILKCVKGSALIIYANNELSKVNLSKEITKRGIESHRLILAKSIPKPQYLARYRAADLFLDTHPYNAGTTASDALKMGLPMLTMKGKSYQARMGASIVNSVNLPELITNTQEEYESLAIELATNPEKLKAIKDKLKSNLPTAPLYDTKLFAKNIESAYTQMYERHHKGLEPDHIYVE